MNIAIICGEISGIVVIDIDDLNKLSELRKILPEIDQTTKVRTPGRGGLHYYFEINGTIPSPTKNLFDLGIELQSKGHYAVAPPSKSNNKSYEFEIPLNKILPYPERAIEIDREILQKKRTNYRGVKPPKGQNIRDIQKNYTPVKLQGLPAYHGKNKIPCIRQILERELIKGERDNSLYILYNLLLQQRNDREYSKEIVRKKNDTLKNPLTRNEVERIFNTSYNLGCSSIIKKLSYIECSNCKLKYKNGELKMSNPLVRHERKLLKMSNTDRGIATLIGTVYQREKVTPNKIANDTGMDYRTVSRSLKRLEEMGFYTP